MSVHYYVDGNTVRKINRENNKRRKKLNKKANKIKKQIKKNQKVAVIDIAYLFSFILAIVLSIYICIYYLNIQSNLNTRRDRIGKMEIALENLKVENDALEQSIDTIIDLNYVYQVAINDLGMIHAGPENIIYYDKTETEYVRQYEEIPK